MGGCWNVRARHSNGVKMRICPPGDLYYQQVYNLTV